MKNASLKLGLGSSHNKGSTQSHLKNPLNALLLAGLVLGTALPTPSLAAAKKPAKETPKAAKDKKGAPKKETKTAAPKHEEETPTLGTVNIVGSKKKARQLPGSAAFVEKAEIQVNQADDISKVLKFVPGVFVRQEDGNGILPGISLRGVDSGRSAKITMMEDGVLISPAPYAAPSAYYTPTVGRMAGLEVLKGSSQIKYGPHTTGGVINYISTPIPNQYEAKLRMAMGSYNEQRAHLTVGDKWKDGKRTIGYLVEVYRRSSDGFKELDKTGFLATSESRETGFEKTEPMIKLSYEPGDKKYSKVEFKWGLMDLSSKETYLGLTDRDFKAKPNRRYAASAFDSFPALHHTSMLRYTKEHGKKTDSTTTLYYNKFRRSWFKHDGPVTDTPAALAVLQGLADGTWPYVDNNRIYYGQGLETVIRHRTGKTTKQDWEVGLRFHQDEERRVHHRTVFTISGSSPTGQPGPWVTNAVRTPADNRVMGTDALSLYVQNAIKKDRWTLTPGVRLEFLDMTYTDYTKNNPAAPWERTAKKSMTIPTMGIGGTYKSSDKWSLLGGIYQGSAPPGPDAATGGDRVRPFSPSANLEEERSLSFEFGGRFEDQKKQMALEAVLFYTDFNDLIVTGNAGAGGLANTPYNGGDITTKGLELSFIWDPATARRKAYKNPWKVSTTWTDATIDETIPANGNLFSGGRAGNKVPYVPEWQFSLGTGLDKTKWGVDASLTYISDFWSTASNNTHATDTRIGQIDSQFTVDFSAWWKTSKKNKLRLDFQNLFGQDYIASRHPHGVRPGAPFMALIGLEWDH